MLKNYILTAIRSILKQRIYSLINVTGLAIGLASCIMIFLYVENEYSYDDFHPKADRIYKVFLERSYPDHVTHYAIIPHSYADVIASDIPEVEQTVRMFSFGGGATQVTYIDENDERFSFEEEHFVLADSNFLDVFSLEMVKGEKENILVQPQSMVISTRAATKYFGDGDPIGKTLISDFGEFRIGGVYNDFPENSHFNIDFIGSVSTFGPFVQNLNFTGFDAHTYVELKPNADATAVQSKLPELVDKYAAPQIEQNLNTTYEEYIAAGNGYNYTMVNIRDIHLDPQDYQLAFKAGGNKYDVYVFISIAVLILIIACINFMNLAIARSSERGKEVGIRKALGSQKKQLVFQFLTESVIISLFALVIATLFVYLAMPYFNSMVQKNLELNLDGSMVLPGLLLFTILVGLLAGSYPAFVLSSFNPVIVMKGIMKKGNKASMLRNGLVVLQFTISIILILSTLIINDQMAFIRNKDLGFKRDNVLIVERSNVLAESNESFVNAVRQLPGVVNASGSNAFLAGQYFGIQFQPRGGNEVITTNGIVVSDDFIETMDIDIIEGRPFSEDMNDSLSVIINEETAKLIEGEVLGTVLETQFGNPPQLFPLEVIGVAKNFHYMSLRDAISPFVLLSNEVNPVNNPNIINVRISGDYNSVLSSVEELWKERVPEEPFKYTFLDTELDDMYQNEANSGKRISTFAILAIIIACIGLFGLSAYTAGLRTKEIGVRKVMGASVGRIIFLLTTDFTKLVVIAFVLAIPIGWYSMDKWLENFVYATGVNIMNFLWAGIITVGIAWFTVIFQSLKAARSNPVDSLRSE